MSLIGAGAGFLANGLLNMFNNSRTNEANKEIQRNQQEFDLKMWNLKNFYDSPEQQMLRLKDAGLNPNLVYGSGGVTGTSGPPVKSSTYDSVGPLSGVHIPDILSVIQTVTEVEKGKAEIELKKSQRDLVDTNKTFQQTLLDYGYPSAKAGREVLNQFVENATWEDKRDALKAQFKKAGIELDSASIDKRMKELNLQQNEELKEFNMNANDDIISRLLVKILNNFRK